MNLELVTTSEFTRLLTLGIRRVAWVAARAPNYDRVLAASIRWDEFEPIIDPTTQRIPISQARTWLSGHFSSAVFRSYVAPDTVGYPTILAYAYTKNNRKEIAFLQNILDGSEAPVQVLNVCEWRIEKRRGVRCILAERLLAAFDEAFLGDTSIAPGLLHQLGNFGTSIDGALSTLNSDFSRVLAVANDHSPAPVAYSMVARALGHRVIYLQHAEVSEAFPPLDFDLSILRNQRSLEVYKRIGNGRGDVVVASRDEGPWISPRLLDTKRALLRKEANTTVAIYPSAILIAERLQAVVASLRANPSVGEILLKPHPNMREALPLLTRHDVRVVRSTPSAPHVAICGNSSIVIELLGGGNIVFQDFSLDGLTADYYGFVSSGLVHELPLDLEKRFWDGREGDFAVNEDALALYWPRVCTLSNVLASLRLKPALLAGLSKVAIGPELGEEASKIAAFCEAVIRLDRNRLAEFERAQGSSWVMRTLDSFPEAFTELMVFTADSLGSECGSLVDLWLLARAAERNTEISQPLRAATRRFARGYRGPAGARSWVRSQARSVQRRVARRWWQFSMVEP